MFYENRLQCKADHSRVSVLENWDGLPKRGVPIAFFAVNGKDVQPEHSTSWYNPFEGDKAVHLAEKLSASHPKACGKRGENITIVAGFKLQQSYIRQQIKASKCPAVKVLPIETIQGQEQQVLILSTVRSSQLLVDQRESDERHSIGLMFDGGRINTAITRAVALLLIVGDDKALGHDPVWNKLLKMLKKKGAFKAADLSQPEELESEFQTQKSQPVHDSERSELHEAFAAEDSRQPEPCAGGNVGVPTQVTQVGATEPEGMIVHHASSPHSAADAETVTNTPQPAFLATPAQRSSATHRPAVPSFQNPERLPGSNEAVPMRPFNMNPTMNQLPHFSHRSPPPPGSLCDNGLAGAYSAQMTEAIQPSSYNSHITPYTSLFFYGAKPFLNCSLQSDNSFHIRICTFGLTPTFTFAPWCGPGAAMLQLEKSDLNDVGLQPPSATSCTINIVPSSHTSKPQLVVLNSDAVLIVIRDAAPQIRRGH